MAIFNAKEILEFAVRIEENGEKYYRCAAQITEDEEARYMFNHLADEEIKHKDFFSSLLKNRPLAEKMSEQAQPETYPGEYAAYLKNYLDNNVVFNTKADLELAGITDTLAAINFAIDRETDSILYYSEIKGLVPASQSPMVDEIIAEERRHFMRLTEFRKGYEKS